MYNFKIVTHTGTVREGPASNLAGRPRQRRPGPHVTAERVTQESPAPEDSGPGEQSRSGAAYSFSSLSSWQTLRHSQHLMAMEERMQTAMSSAGPSSGKYWQPHVVS